MGDISFYDQELNGTQLRELFKVEAVSTYEYVQTELGNTFEFKLHRHGGLVLLMTQAAGMQGEDFLNDYSRTGCYRHCGRSAC